MKFSPIGYIECAQRYRYEAARQPSIAPENEAWIRLHQGQVFVDSLRGLADFDRIWVVYVFHLNETWHPLVQPPRTNREKVGVLASRSPHRPNRIGMSCVRLIEIERHVLHVAQHDFLDKTPVLDLKPYLPYADAFPNAKAGWVDTISEKIYQVDIIPTARDQMTWVADRTGWDLNNFVQVQLRTDPLDTRRKRISRVGHGLRIAFRTWRIDYQLDTERCCVKVLGVSSGYSPVELANATSDLYADKPIHRSFMATFARQEITCP